MRTDQRVARRCAMPNILPLLPILGSLVLMLAGCGEPKLESLWRDREVTIDGDHTEWEGAVVRVDDVDAVVGLLNDDTHLYLCLASIDQNVMSQVLGGGLTLWILSLIHI